MPRSFDISTVKWRDPRVAVRAVLGVLLAANLAAAVIAFKPFGVSDECAACPRTQHW